MAGQSSGMSRKEVRATLASLEVNKQNQNGNVKATTYGNGCGGMKKK